MGKKQKKGQIGAFICGFIIFVIFIFPLDGSYSIKNTGGNL